MRRAIAVLMAGLFILLGACGEEASVSPAIEFRAALVQAGGCTFRADVEADFGGNVEHFTLDCEADADGTTRFSVVAPETLAGISATVTESGGKITYDGMAMDFGLLANGNVIPAAAPALAVCCWSGEYIASGGEEDALYRATYEKDFDEKMLTVDTWYENSIPICAEVCYNNQRILKLSISEFTMK